MTDPNGWVKNPPSVFVKVHGTSRETLNGSYGVVIQYLNDRSRYTILLTNSQDQVSLKPDNLIECNMIEKGKAYYEMMTNNPQIRQQMQQLSSQVYARTGVKPQHLLGGIVFSFIFGWYILGFSRIMMIITTLIMIITVIGPDLATGADRATIIRNAPNRWKTVIREQIPVIGPKIANNKYLFQLFTGLLLAFIIFSLKSSPARTNNKLTAAETTQHRNLLSIDMQQHYYKLGYDDATNNNDYGFSLSEPLETATTKEFMDTSQDEFSYNDELLYSTPPAKKSSSPFNLSTGLALYTIYKTIGPMAINGEGKFDIQLLRANISTMEVWKLGILGFAIYRIISAFI